MKNFLQKLWKNFKRPNAWQLGILYWLTFVLCAFAVGLLIDEKSGAVAQTFADVVYAVAGLTLAYTVYTIIVYLPIVKNSLSQIIKRSPRKDYNSRTPQRGKKKCSPRPCPLLFRIFYKSFVDSMPWIYRRLKIFYKDKTARKC